MEQVKEFAERYRNTEWITIAIEGSETTFSVQKALLCQASDYFKKALNGPMKEAQEGRLRLPECDIPTFELFLHWLWKNELPDFRTPFEADLGSSMDESQKMGGDVQLLLVRLWSFGDAYLMPKLQNAAIRALAHFLFMARVEPDVIKQIFQTTTKESVVRDLIMREVVEDCQAHYYTEEELNQLGATPGFLDAMFQDCPLCNELPCKCEVPSAVNRDLSEFLVAE